MDMDSLARRVWNAYYGNDTLISRDAFGDRIHKADYGDHNSTYGWYVDHIRPKSEGGTDKLSNLRPVRIRSKFSSWRRRSTKAPN